MTWARTEAARLVNLALYDERQREADRRAVPRGHGRRSDDVAFITPAEMVASPSACWYCGAMVDGRDAHVCGLKGSGPFEAMEAAPEGNG